jgi:hypothetical protein
MQKKYVAPELTLIGQADEVVLGSSTGGVDLPNETSPDFEFEYDWWLI